MLTFQGHAEFDRFINRETLKVFAKAGEWKDEFLVEKLKSVEKEDDAIWAAGMMLKFFLGDEKAIDAGLVMQGKGGCIEDSEVMARL